ncbi:MAG TPA: hypothetical protein VJ438_01695 [Candidatus Nanoarchaeia archaeon]|nr:hypothetical protein [Candidatus Nanoarchaeia archaeon]
MVLRLDSQTWKELQNPYILLRPFNFKNEDGDITLNSETFGSVRDFIYNPMKQTIIFNEGEESCSYQVYSVSRNGEQIINSDFLGYVGEDVVRSFFPRAYKEARSHVS